MVKGVSRQVIVVHGPGEELFEQAIFILKDSAVETGVTDDVLMKQARQAIRREDRHTGNRGMLWAAGGAAVTAMFWLLTVLL